MPPEQESATIPKWAADLRVDVAEIRGQTKTMADQLPELLRRIEEVRASTVPLSEHSQLMQRVETLWDRDLGARADWERVVARTDTLWQERARIRGAIAFVVFVEGIAALYFAARGGHIP